MRRAIFLSLACAASVALVACGNKTIVNNAVKNPAALKRNCDFLLERFDSAVSNFALCNGVNRQTYDTIEPFMAGGVLKSVDLATVETTRTKKVFQEYKLNLVGMDALSDIYVFSETPIEYVPGQFYAVDMMNICRFKVLQSPGQLTADLLNSFDTPKKIACK